VDSVAVERGEVKVQELRGFRGLTLGREAVDGPGRLERLGVVGLASGDEAVAGTLCVEAEGV
jgi:hypothetical protein